MNQKENIYVLIPKQNEEINLKDLEKFLKILPKERVKKYYAYVKELDKKNCILSYLLLCYILNKDYDIFITPKFKYGKNKKPYFENIKKLYFNLSHSNNKIAGAVSDCNIGIDIQEQRKISVLICIKLNSLYSSLLMLIQKSFISKVSIFFILSFSICFKSTSTLLPLLFISLSLIVHNRQKHFFLSISFVYDK